jgi:hypothetical protein
MITKKDLEKDFVDIVNIWQEIEEHHQWEMARDLAEKHLMDCQEIDKPMTEDDLKMQRFNDFHNLFILEEWEE